MFRVFLIKRKKYKKKEKKKRKKDDNRYAHQITSYIPRTM
jgi:hypothetical protein